MTEADLATVPVWRPQCTVGKMGCLATVCPISDKSSSEETRLQRKRKMQRISLPWC